uniref:TRNase Z endonuclease domain-containing protein n=1 Tax=Plectus sambesii TaxID=2011161 RepID=A0A914UTD9_9BILA
MVLFRRSCSLLQSRIDLALFNRASQLGRALPYFCFAPVEPCSSALVTNSRRHHNSFPRRPGGDGRDRRQSGSKQQSELEKESFAEDNDKELWRHLRRRINDQQAQAKKEPIGSERCRQPQSTITSRTITMNALRNTREQKKGANAPLSDSTIQKSPSNATIEILSNGTANVRPCVALRTTFQLYLFDCPEGTYRHMCGTRLNHRSLFDVFITRGDWEHTGGVPGVVVSKEQFQHK